MLSAQELIDQAKKNAQAAAALVKSNPTAPATPVQVPVLAPK